MRRRRGGALTPEDRQLWDLVRRTAAPLAPTPVEEEGAAERPAGAPRKKPASPAPPVVVQQPPAPALPQGPARLDQRTRSRLSRGVADVDARIDLHGMTQAVAHQRLKRFLEEGQAQGARLVLVITGKGKPAEDYEFGSPERGVLRRAVPEWLQSPDLRHLVAGYDEAGRRHGAGGALYVRIRRKRG